MILLLSQNSNDSETKRPALLAENQSGKRKSRWRKLPVRVAGPVFTNTTLERTESRHVVSQCAVEV